jgi:hypothetical protein
MCVRVRPLMVVCYVPPRQRGRDKRGPMHRSASGGGGASGGAKPPAHGPRSARGGGGAGGGGGGSKGLTNSRRGVKATSSPRAGHATPAESVAAAPALPEAADSGAAGLAGAAGVGGDGGGGGGAAAPSTRTTTTAATPNFGQEFLAMVKSSRAALVDPRDGRHKVRVCVVRSGRQVAPGPAVWARLFQVHLKRSWFWLLLGGRSGRRRCIPQASSSWLKRRRNLLQMDCRCGRMALGSE